VSDYGRQFSYGSYGDSTDLRAQQIAAQREADSAAAEAEREAMQLQDHLPQHNHLFPGFCGRCGLHNSNPIHGRKAQQ
jgi:hypothetical protein